MTDKRWIVLIKALKKRMHDLNQEEEINSDAGHTVTLDQQSVGRLSRIDALQQQAMAKALTKRRITEKKAIAQALLRIKNNEYGTCIECGEDIEKARLIINPTVLKCIECVQDS